VLGLQHYKADLQEAGLFDEPGDDRARFLRELRELRTEAGLGYAELAARAHYPHDVIRAAEAGPSLPSLPVLSAYVRGCGGTPAEWEERWRSLTSSPALPLLPARSAGESEAATAGARVGAETPVGDGYDPAIVMAALNRVADGMATDSSSLSSSPSAAVAGSGMADAADAHSPGAASMSGAVSLPGAAPSATHAGRPAPAANSPDPAGPSPDNVTPPAAAPAPTASRPQGGFPMPAAGQAAGAGSPRLIPPRTALAALVVILCLAAILLALFG
jgi:Helix-turn-helix domain